MTGNPGDDGKDTPEEPFVRVADGDEPDWSQLLEGARDPAGQRVVQSLRAIREMANAQRRLLDSPESDSEPGVPEGPVLETGRRLGPYEVLGRIGVGGMGEVYRARQTQLNRDVAIKTLPWHAQISADARRRFEREAHISASLVHRNVVAIHDFCEYEDIAFVVEELLEGASWRSLLRESPGIPSTQAVRMIADAASGLAAAHAVGLIHRDIKPENLFETRSGETKVLDFGLARLLDPASSPHDGSATSGSVGFGTPAYTAPECLRGAPADQRSDVFALSCSAYELFSGTSPFVRANTGDTIVALLKDSPKPLDRVVSGLPGDLARLIDRGLSKSPEDRPLASEIAAAASVGNSGSGRLALHAAGRKARARGARIAALVLISVLVAGYAAYVARRPWTVAVVRFDSSGLPKDLDYVGLTMSEWLNTRLARASGLDVRSRFLVGQAASQNPQEVGRTLGVARVVQGRLLTQGTEIAAEIQILDAATGLRKWNGRFIGTPSNLPDLEQRILAGVTSGLGVVFPTESGHAPLRSINPEAYRLYAEGRYRWLRQTKRELFKAVDLLTQALAIEPDFALAHASLARAYIDITYYASDVSSRETKVVARREAERAITLDPALPQALTALADVEASEWRRDDAHVHYRRAMELDPTDSDPYLGDAIDVLIPTGKFDEARSQLRRGLGLGVSSLAREALARVSYYQRDYPRSVNELESLLESDPGFISARYRLGQVLVAKGEPEKGLVPLREAQAQTGGLAMGRAMIVYGLATSGRREEAETEMAALLKERETAYVSAALIGVAFAGLGDTDKSIEWLRRGCEEHAEHIHLLGVEPMLDPIRKDPRYPELLRCVGLRTQ